MFADSGMERKEPPKRTNGSLTNVKNAICKH